MLLTAVLLLLQAPPLQLLCFDLIMAPSRARAGRWAGCGRQDMDHPNYFLTRGDWDQLNSASSMETKMGVIADRLQAPVSYVARLSTRELQLHVRCVVRGVAPRRIRAVAPCLSLHRRSGWSARRTTPCAPSALLCAC